MVRFVKTCSLCFFDFLHSFFLVVFVCFPYFSILSSLVELIVSEKSRVQSQVSNLVCVTQSFSPQFSVWTGGILGGCGSHKVLWTTHGMPHDPLIPHCSGESGLSHPYFNQSTVTSLFIIFSLTGKALYLKEVLLRKKINKTWNPLLSVLGSLFTSRFWIEYFMKISSFLVPY